MNRNRFIFFYLIEALNNFFQCEKGNVARIVDRLSKDYGSGLGNSTMVSTKSENVPLRNRGFLKLFYRFKRIFSA